MGNGIIKRKFRGFKSSIAQRQAAAEIRRRKVREAALRERQIQAIRLARERERLRIERRIRSIKTRATEPGFFTAIGQGFASAGSGLRSTTIQRRKPSPKLKSRKIKRR